LAATEFAGARKSTICAKSAMALAQPMLIMEEADAAMVQPIAKDAAQARKAAMGSVVAVRSKMNAEFVEVLAQERRITAEALAVTSMAAAAAQEIRAVTMSAEAA
jgi:hypothetical protein